MVLSSSLLLLSAMNNAFGGVYVCVCVCVCVCVFLSVSLCVCRVRALSLDVETSYLVNQSINRKFNTS